MRILFLVLVAAALVGGLVLWRSAPPAAQSGVQPGDAPAATAREGAVVLDAVGNSAERGGRAEDEGPDGAREAIPPPAPPPPVSPEIAKAAAAVAEPAMEDGVVLAPVGAVASGDAALAAKYRDMDRGQRLQALEAIRAVLASSAGSTDKDVQSSYPAWKDELAWLESHLDE